MIPDDRTPWRKRCVRFLLLLLALIGSPVPRPIPASEPTEAAADVDEPLFEEFPQPVEAERAAAGKVRALGGWYELDAERHVIEVNMVYHEDPLGRRQDNDQKTDEILEHLPSFPRLELLLLKEGQASDDGLVFVGRLPKLEKLYIWDAGGITDAGVANLSGLSRLSYLHLSKSQITDEAILHLSNLPLLEGLSMQQNAFTDKALEYAAKMPRLKTMVLDNGAQFTDEGMQHIRNMPMLEEIWLQNTGITDEGLQALHGLKTLKLVVFNNNDFAAAGNTAIEELQKATPSVNVRQGGKLLPSINALAVANDPKQQELVRRQALDGLKAIEQFLSLLESKQDTKAAGLARSDVVARMQALRRQPDFEPLKVSVASGTGDVVQALTTPAVMHELFDQQGKVRERRLAFVGLVAKKKAGTWRVEFFDFQDEGSNTWMQRFLTDHPDAQKVR